MTRSAADYAEQLHALAPTGPLWRALCADRIWSGLVDALAQEFARIDARAQQLIDETDPLTILELLSEAEAAVGLPDSCRGLGTSIEQRRADLLARRTDKGGYSAAIWRMLIEGMGFTNVTFDEFHPHDVMQSVDAPLYGDDWVNAFRINATAPAATQMTVMSSVDESLGDIAPTSNLECVVRRKAASHTTPLFNYA